MQYTALMIDLVSSRKYDIETRNEIQRQLKQAIDLLNQLYAPAIKFDVVFSAGDEVQGLFKSTAAAILYHRSLCLMMSPNRFRAGIGVGTWTIQMPEGLSTEQDGSSYHNARKAIELTNIKRDASIQIIMDTNDDVALNVLINVASKIQKKQTIIQHAHVCLLEAIDPIFDARLMRIEMMKEYRYHLIKHVFDSETIVNEQNKIIDIQSLYAKQTSDIQGKPFTQHIKDYGLKKGVSFRMAEVTKTSRQNVEKILKSSNIEMIRELEVSALCLLQSCFRETV